MDEWQQKLYELKDSQATFFRNVLGVTYCEWTREVLP